MALKLPWKYKSLVAVINSYGESEGDINNFAVTGSFESFHPLTFFISSPLPRGREAGQWREGGWYRQLLNFTQQSQLLLFFLTWLLLSFPSISPVSLSPSVPLFCSQSFKASIKVQINWCSSDASVCWNFFLDIYWSSGSVPSLPPSLFHLSVLADRTAGRFSVPAGLTLYLGWHISGTNTVTY